MFDSNVPEYFGPHERVDFEACIDQLDGPYFVLMDEWQEIIASGGYASEHNVPSTAVLCWGMVRRDLHGQGLGEKLLGIRLAAIAAERIFKTVIIETTQFSRGFFERFGFVAGEVIRNGYGSGYDLVPMRLDLPRDPVTGPERRCP